MVVPNRSRAALISGQATDLAFVARPAPQKATESERWAVAQFEELERVIRGMSQRIRDLESGASGGGRTWDEI